MRVAQAHFEILTPISEGGLEELQKIERIGRSCYGSEDKITNDSCYSFVRGLISRGHMSPIEHSSLTVKFVIDRAMSHELVRHRLAAFMQSSQRYQNYGSEKYGGEITVIDIAPFVPRDTEPYYIWYESCAIAEANYLRMLKSGEKPEFARTVLPTSTMTELTITANYREWRHILAMRTGNGAYPPLREICTDLLADLREKIPVVFDTLE